MDNDDPFVQYNDYIDYNDVHEAASMNYILHKIEAFHLHLLQVNKLHWMEQSLDQ